MKITEYTLGKKTFSYVAALLLIVGGIHAYLHLGRLEFPVFTIKTALVITPYPGAGPKEVEEQVTDILETAIQQLGQVKKVRSMSRAGLSTIFVDMKDSFTSDQIPQIWDELRRKVSDIQPHLPKGAGPSLVNDDFTDEYGVFFAIHGEGFTQRELLDYAKILRRELLLVKDVASVELYGSQPETIYLEISRSKMAELGICLNDMVATLNKQGLVADGGRVQVNDQYIRVVPTGGFDTLEDLRNLIVRCGPGGSEVYLKDLAQIQRGYQEPIQNMLLFNGQPALGIGVATTSDGNVVTMGRAIHKRIEQLAVHAPAGIQMGVISYQSDTVTRSLQGFTVNFIEALIIVIVVLFFAMGLNAGMLMGGVLLVTILGTFIGMRLMDINLQIISLGALVLSLGMLVDNAIVVTEGIMIRIQGGMGRTLAALETCAQTAWPLLGATIMAILAFAAIAASKDTTGEFMRSLFKVMAISLALSWVLAVTLTPLLCIRFLSPRQGRKRDDPYNGFLFQQYKKILHFSLGQRRLVILILVALVILAGIGFSQSNKNLFPSSDRPQFMLDYWLPEGGHINQTTKDLIRIDAHIRGLEGVTGTAAFIGSGALRFILTYEPHQPNTSYGQILVTVSDLGRMESMMTDLNAYLAKEFPNAEAKCKTFYYGEPLPSRIEARFSGPDPAVLRKLSEQAKAIMAADPETILVRDNWRQPVETIQPVVNEAVARRTGITRVDVARAIQTAFAGQAVGWYREGDALIPIVLRAPASERRSVNQLHDLRVFAPLTGQSLSLDTIVSEYQTAWQDPIIWRYNRKRAITASCDPSTGQSGRVFNRLRPKIEALALAPGYELAWEGEYAKMIEAYAGLNQTIPVFCLAMAMTILAMFNSIRQTVLIFLCLPLSLIGVAIGFSVTGMSFDFTSTLGFLGLSGMIIKNAVVLIDQINLDRKSGKPLHDAIVDASTSRLRPVCMASLTTILGMAPLLWHPFFGPMSLTIISGLTFGTLLTLIIVPVLYFLFHRERRTSGLFNEKGISTHATQAN